MWLLLDFARYRSADTFVADRYGPAERRRRQLAHDDKAHVKMWRGFVRQHPAMKGIIAVVAAGAIYTIFVIGLILGLIVSIALKTPPT